jgi:predicted metal-dependent peptidase
MPADAQQEMVAEVREAVAQGQVLAAVAGAKTNRSHEGALVPEVLWHEIFREFVKTNVTKGEDLTTWRRYKGSLVGQGVYMPTYYSERMTRLVVARDTSGSISDAVINLFNGYLVSIADEVRPEEIIVLDWGSGVVNDERYTELEGYDAIMTRTRVMGGGGTSPECIGSYLKHHNIEADAIVVLTDGCFDRYDFDDYGSPTLWCVLPEYWDHFKGTMPKFGQAVKINGF